MVRRLLRNVEGLGSRKGLEVPVASEPLTENWIQGLLDATAEMSALGTWNIDGTHVRRFDMPSTQVELNDGNEALLGIIDGRHREQGLRMLHEAEGHSTSSASLLGTWDTDHRSPEKRHHILRNPLQHALRLQDKSRQGDPTEIRPRP